MTPDQGTVVLLRSLAIDPCIVRKLRLGSRLLRWARCKAVLKSHAHPEMPFCRFRMTRMARPALNHQRAHRAGGTALANVEPEELSHSLVSSSPQDCVASPAGYGRGVVCDSVCVWVSSLPGTAVTLCLEVSLPLPGPGGRDSPWNEVK